MQTVPASDADTVSAPPAENLRRAVGSRLTDRYGGDAVVFATSLCLYLLTMPRQIGFEDAGLFGLTCLHGDAAHAPGFALYSLVCPLFAHLPGVEPVVGLGIFSALTAAAALVVLRRLLLHLVPALPATLTALAYGASLAFWSQATIPEVYALNVLLTVGALLVLWRFVNDGEPRRLPVLALLVGLGFATHWPLFIASGPAFFVLLLPRSGATLRLMARPRWLVATLAALIVGLLPLAFLVWRLFSPNYISMVGAADAVDDVLAYLARSQYADIDRSRWALASAQTAWLGWLLSEFARQFTLLLLPVIAIGAVTCLRRLPHLAAALFVLFVSHTVVIAGSLEFPFDYVWQSVFRPYPLVAWLAASVWLAFGVDAVAAWLRARGMARNQSAFLLSLLPVVVVVANLPYNDRTTTTFADVHARLVLESLPRNAVLVVSGDSFLPVGYLHARGVAADVDVRELQGLVYPNRLFTPDLPTADQHARWAEFVDTVGRPVFFTHFVDIGRNASWHGLLVRIHPRDEPPMPGCVAFPRQDEFISGLLSVQPLRPAERMQRGELLMAAAFCLMARAPTDPAAARLLQALQKEPDAALASLAWLLAQPGSQSRRSELEQLAAVSETGDRNVLSSRQLALRETLLGKLDVLHGDSEAARRHFVRALKLRDPPSHGAHVALATLYVQEGSLTSLADLLRIYNDVSDLQPFRRYLELPAASATAVGGPADAERRSAETAPASK